MDQKQNTEIQLEKQYWFLDNWLKVSEGITDKLKRSEILYGFGEFYKQKKKEEEEEREYCTVGDHFVSAKEMWPDFSDCFECATPKEYAEQMGISKDEAESICSKKEEEE